jgi:colanic acid biosynthesis glycosyl transferase WcaI
MKILVDSIYCPPELTGISKYSSEIVEWLAANNHSVQVITNAPFYPEWKIANPYSGSRYSIERGEGVSIFRCPVYVPKRLTALSRVLHFLSFSLSSLPIFLKMLFWRPDLVINPVPTLLVSPCCEIVWCKEYFAYPRF